MIAKAGIARFGSRAAIVAITMFCLWAGAVTKKERDQRTAVDAVRSAGGRVVYDYQQLANQLGFFQWEVPALRPSWSWLNQLWGGDALTDVNAVSLGVHGEPALSRAELGSAMSAIPRLYGLKSLGIACGELHGADLNRIGSIQSLQHLTLDSASASATELTFLGKLTNLRELSLSGKRIDGSGLRHLAKLQTLHTLSLAGDWLSDRDLVHLEPLTSLSSLNLDSSQITSKGLASLERLHHLRHVALRSGSLGGAGMRSLARLHALDYLNLASCDLNGTVSGAAGTQAAVLIELQRARQLSTLQLGAEELSPAAWQALSKIPNLRHVISYQNTAVDDDAFQAIKQLTKLESLTILMAPQHQRELAAELPHLTVISE